jgi:CRP-like cAMP-binding protein
MDTESLFQLYQQWDHFKDLDLPVIQALAQASTYHKQDLIQTYLVTEHKQNTTLYILIEGSFRIEIDKSLINLIDQPGDTIGEMSWVTMSLATASVIAEPGTAYLSIYFDDLEKINSLHKGSLRNHLRDIFPKIISKRLITTNQKAKAVNELIEKLRTTEESLRLMNENLGYKASRKEEETFEKIQEITNKIIPKFLKKDNSNNSYKSTKYNNKYNKSEYENNPHTDQTNCYSSDSSHHTHNKYDDHSKYNMNDKDHTYAKNDTHDTYHRNNSHDKNDTYDKDNANNALSSGENNIYNFEPSEYEELKNELLTLKNFLEKLSSSSSEETEHLAAKIVGYKLDSQGQSALKTVLSSFGLNDDSSSFLTNSSSDIPSKIPPIAIEKSSDSSQHIRSEILPPTKIKKTSKTSIKNGAQKHILITSEYKLLMPPELNTEADADTNPNAGSHFFKNFDQFDQKVLLLRELNFTDLKNLTPFDTLLHCPSSGRSALIRTLITGLNKIMFNNIWGLQKYLSWGTKIHQLQISDSSKRLELIESLTTKLKTLGIRSAILTQIHFVLEELLMNALYDAPTNNEGNPLYNHLHRKEKIQLPRGKEISVHFGSDGITAGISVSDPFGSLKKETILSYLESGAKGLSINNPEKGGAGKGLYLIVSNSSQTIFNVERQARTEVVCLFDLDRKNHDPQSDSPSLHYYFKP